MIGLKGAHKNLMGHNAGFLLLYTGNKLHTKIWNRMYILLSDNFPKTETNSNIINFGNPKRSISQPLDVKQKCLCIRNEAIDTSFQINMA